MPWPRTSIEGAILNSPTVEGCVSVPVMSSDPHPLRGMAGTAGLSWGWTSGLDEVLPEIIEDIGPRAESWADNTYAPGGFPLERSIFLSSPEAIRLAYEPLSWGSPEARLARIAHHLPGELRPPPPGSVRFGVFRGLRRLSVGRWRRFSYVEAERQSGAHSMRVPHFVRCGLGPPRVYYELPELVDSETLVGQVEELVGWQGARSLAMRLRHLLRASELPPNSFVISGLGETSLKVECRVRLVVDPDRIWSSLLAHVPSRQASSFRAVFDALQLTINILRSEERRVGKECVSECRSRWSPYH